jgi:hypothetical protein
MILLCFDEDETLEVVGYCFTKHKTPQLPRVVQEVKLTSANRAAELQIF